jgi:hypothetical protein
MKTSSHFPILRQSKGSARAFTLIEVLVSSGILVLIVLFVSQMVSSTNSSIRSGKRMMDADQIARQTFDRMFLDFSKITRQPDIDVHFEKEKGNDRIYFFSEAPADSDSSSSDRNTIALVGYQVNDDAAALPPQLGLMRLGKGVSWDRSPSGKVPSMPFLTFPAGSFLPLPTSTIQGVFAEAVRKNSPDPDHHLLGPDVIRFEYYFLLKDGTFSNKPMKATAPPVTSNLNVAGPPSIRSDRNSGFSTGSRWWDREGSRGYQCTNSSVGSAVWRPLGFEDVAAVVVTIAVLDGAALPLKFDRVSLAELLQESDDVDLSKKDSSPLTAEWNKAVEALAMNPPAGLPKGSSRLIRIYQRFFYLNP